MKHWWSDQYINGLYPSLAPTNQPFGVLGKPYFDLGAGAAISAGSADSKVQWFGGMAIFHVNRPVISYGADYTLPARWAINAGLASAVDDNLDKLVLNADYFVQAGESEFLIGAYYKFNGRTWENYKGGGR